MSAFGPKPYDPNAPRNAIIGNLGAGQSGVRRGRNHPGRPCLALNALLVANPARRHHRINTNRTLVPLRLNTLAGPLRISSKQV
jgi:hypothetical protein